MTTEKRTYLDVIGHVGPPKGLKLSINAELVEVTPEHPSENWLVRVHIDPFAEPDAAIDLLRFIADEYETKRHQMIREAKQDQIDATH